MNEEGLVRFQKNVVKAIYKNFDYEIKSLIKTFNTSDLEKMKIALKDWKEDVLVNNDYINILIDINSLAYGLKLLDDIGILLMLRNSDTEKKAREYSKIDE